MDAAAQPRLRGMPAFLIVWFGQVISLLGTAMTQFALAIWAYDLTKEATALALVAFFGFGPTVVFSPIAGALVDRWNRKLVMMLSDIGAGLATLAILLLYMSGSLQIWHLYAAAAWAGVFQSFQFPAYSASISLMLKKEDYARASALLGLAESGSTILAPIFASAVIGVLGMTSGISAIIAFDLVSFLVALAALAWVFIPQPPRTEAGEEGKGSLMAEAAYGFRYILARPSLLGLQLVFFSINLIATLSFTILAPMVLARTNQDAGALGITQSAAGIGGVVGGILIGIWGGPKRKVHGVLLGMAAGSLLGQMLVGAGSTVWFWAAGSFFSAFFIPLINGSNQAIWQAKVAPDVQGRVFAVRRLIAQITAPVGMLLSGPLADRVFEPAMREGGSLAPIFGGLLGTGPGAGMGLMFLLIGAAGVLVGIGGYLFRAVREAETLLPDHAAVQPAGTD